jgi:hypothetical protein
MLQTSTNLSVWKDLVSLTNYGWEIEWNHSPIKSARRYFRAVPQ